MPVQPKRPPERRDVRFRYDAWGRQIGRDWTPDGLDNPPDNERDQPMDEPVRKRKKR